MITVVEQTTSERKAETAALFEKCKPYLQKGMGLHKAAWKAKGVQPTNARNGWYRELIEYAMTQGYNHYEHRWERGAQE